MLTGVPDLCRPVLRSPSQEPARLENLMRRAGFTGADMPLSAGRVHNTWHWCGAPRTNPAPTRNADNTGTMFAETRHICTDLQVPHRLMESYQQMPPLRLLWLKQRFTGPSAFRTGEPLKFYRFCADIYGSYLIGKSMLMRLGIQVVCSAPGSFMSERERIANSGRDSNSADCELREDNSPSTKTEKLSSKDVSAVGWVSGPSP